MFLLTISHTEDFTNTLRLMWQDRVLIYHVKLQYWAIEEQKLYRKRKQIVNVLFFKIIHNFNRYHQKNLKTTSTLKNKALQTTDNSYFNQIKAQFICGPLVSCISYYVTAKNSHCWVTPWEAEPEFLGNFLRKKNTFFCACWRWSVQWQ